MPGAFFLSLLFSSALSAAGFGAVSPGRARQVLAVLSAHQPPDALRPLRTLNADDPMQRLMLGPLAEAMAEAEAAGAAPETAYASAGPLVEKAIEELLSDEERSHQDDPELLRYRLLRLRQLAPFYAPERLQEVAEAATRRGAKGRLASQAVKIMREGKRDLTPSMSQLLLVDNQLQLDVIAAMIKRNNVPIAGNIEHVLRVSTPLQRRAIVSMLEGNRNIDPSIERLATLVRNEHQVETLEVLIPVKGFRIADNLDEILRASNSLQTRAVKAMAERGRDLPLTLSRLTTQITNEHQAAAVEALAGSNGTDADALLDGILAISNPVQVEALKLLLKRGESAPKDLRALARFYNTEQLETLRILLGKGAFWSDSLLENAARAATERARLLVTDWLKNALTSPPQKTIVEELPPLPGPGRLAAFFLSIMALLRLYKPKPAVPRTKTRKEFDRDGMRAANRAWLDSHPEVEGAVGRIVMPDFVAPHVDLAALVAGDGDEALLARARAALADDAPGWSAAQRRQEIRAALESVESATQEQGRLMALDRLRRLLS